MDKKYTVLKKFEGLKKGDSFEPTETSCNLTEEEIEAAVTDGFIQELGDGEKAAKPAVKKAKADSVTATWPGGVREFSLAIHGEDFMEVAKEFCETNGGTIA